MLYVLLGPEHQVEVKHNAVDVCLFLAGRRDAGWLVFRQLDISEATNLGDLTRYLMVIEAIEQQGIEAVSQVASAI